VPATSPRPRRGQGLESWGRRLAVTPKISGRTRLFSRWPVALGRRPLLFGVAVFRHVGKLFQIPRLSDRPLHCSLDGPSPFPLAASKLWTLELSDSRPVARSGSGSAPCGWQPPKLRASVSRLKRETTRKVVERGRSMALELSTLSTLDPRLETVPWSARRGPSDSRSTAGHDDRQDHGPRPFGALVSLCMPVRAALEEVARHTYFHQAVQIEIAIAIKCRSSQHKHEGCHSISIAAAGGRLLAAPQVPTGKSSTWRTNKTLARESNFSVSVVERRRA